MEKGGMKSIENRKRKETKREKGRAAEAVEKICQKKKKTKSTKEKLKFKKRKRKKKKETQARNQKRNEAARVSLEGKLKNGIDET